MSGYNKIIIIGHLGRDPEMKYLPSGDPVADFSVATSERRNIQGQQREQTTWFRVAAFGKLAETCHQNLHKGSYVYLEGSLSQREYTDREGNQRQSLEVRARAMRMLDRRGEESAATMSASLAEQAPPLDDVPF